MDFFIYAADVYCGKCGRDIRRRIRAEGHAPAHPRDETTYDSGEYPKGPYESTEDESDSPQHCGSHDDCLDPTVFADGSRVGKFLENPLTSDGVENLREMLADVHPGTRALHELWSGFYREELRESEPVEFEVIVGNVGHVFASTDRAAADREFDEWVTASRENEGHRCWGEDVTMIGGEDIVREHAGHLVVRDGDSDSFHRVFIGPCRRGDDTTWNMSLRADSEEEARESFDETVRESAGCPLAQWYGADVALMIDGDVVAEYSGHMLIGGHDD